jgi:3-oxoacyl-[acyl-carrier protein] reductase
MAANQKLALITGASSGIGQATAWALAQDYKQMVVTWNTQAEGIEATLEGLRARDVEAEAAKVDLSDPNETFRFVKEFRRAHKNLHLLVNNAGISGAELEQWAAQTWNKVFQINLFSVVQLCEMASDLMAAGGGRIINVSSLYGGQMHGSKEIPAYSASKAALNSFTCTLAKLLAPKILVNAVSPGYTDTPMWHDTSGQAKEQIGKDQLVGRFLSPAEIAAAVLFLAKSESITGEILAVDGGLGLNKIN